MRLIARISNRHSGLKESNLIRLVQAFAISRIVYVAPYLDLLMAEKTRIEALIRKVYKQALGIPVSTPTDRLLALGVHNTLDELIEAHKTAQYERLAQTPTGRRILDCLYIGYATQQGNKADIPREIRERINVLPILRNMHVEHDAERRAERDPQNKIRQHQGRGLR